MSSEVFNQLMKQVYKFNDYALARSFADQGVKMLLIVHGDDGKYWVAVPRVTEQLAKAGYEYA